jgi:hypothetical protein
MTQITQVLADFVILPQGAQKVPQDSQRFALRPLPVFYQKKYFFVTFPDRPRIRMY